MSDTGDGSNSASIVPRIDRQAVSDLHDAQALPIIVHALSSLDVGARATLLSRLLGSVGPLALAVVGRGAFAKYIPYARSLNVPVSPDDAALATPNQIAEVVQYVWQSNPKYFERALLCDLSCAVDLRGKDSNTTSTLRTAPPGNGLLT